MEDKALRCRMHFLRIRHSGLAYRLLWLYISGEFWSDPFIFTKFTSVGSPCLLLATTAVCLLRRHPLLRCFIFPQALGCESTIRNCAQTDVITNRAEGRAAPGLWSCKS